MSIQVPGLSASMAARCHWLDVARGYGMFLIFYGHLVERLAVLSHPGTLGQFKFIYSFHMPMFFVFAGLVAKASPGVMATIRRSLLARVLPAIVFNLLLIPAWLPPSPLADTRYGQHLGKVLFQLVYGKPILNFVTWFLFCLFVVEVLHALLRKGVHQRWPILISIFMLLVIGQEITGHGGLIGRVVDGVPNFWMIREALVALAFHQFGFLLGREGALRATLNRSLVAVVCVLCWVGVMLTYDLNQGPFVSPKPVVLMAIASHGNPFWFPITALLGTCGIASLAMLTPKFNAAGWVGRYSLLFLGLNGVFFVGNGFIAPHLVTVLPGEGGLQVGFLVAGTLASLALTAPLAWILDRWLPQLVGRPGAAGPLLPAFSRRRAS